MALWFEDGLYVCESTDTEGLPQLVYWPPPYGVIRTPYEQWIQQAVEANYHVALLPLAKEFSDRFDESAARAFFDSVEGSPYGWHNFMFAPFSSPDSVRSPLLSHTHTFTHTHAHTHTLSLTHTDRHTHTLAQFRTIGTNST